MVNTSAVSVTKSADGAQTFNPALKGYLTILSNNTGFNSLILWIPYNADGSVRAETRFMSGMVKLGTSPSVHANGDTPGYNVLILSAAFDSVDGKSIFGVDTAGLPRAWKLAYDETLPL